MEFTKVTVLVHGPKGSERVELLADAALEALNHEVDRQNCSWSRRWF